MSLSAVMGISLSGMQAQQTRATATANNVANAMTPGYGRLDTEFSTQDGGGVSASVSETGTKVDLAQEALSLVETEIAFKANASVWETGADMWDVLMSIKRD